MSVRLAVVGWDSATFDVIDPLMAAGRLPVLESLIGRGHRARLRSTWPPMTDCAWTSAFTGANPGRHGIFGSWYRAPGAYECRYFSSRDRRAPALWEMTSQTRHLLWNIPMTFPAESVPGAMVAGYGAPPGARFVEPPELQRELSERYPVADLLDRAPHGSLGDFLDDLIRGLEVQAEAIAWAAARLEADSVSLVWPQIDRAQHFFWRFRNDGGPFGDAVDRVYEAMDAATGRLLESFSGADVLVVSDHGAGTLQGDVNLGAWLASNGFAAYSDGRARRGIFEAAWALPAPVRRAARRVAPGLARKAMSATLTGALAPFDWERTRAFVGFHGDLWLNLAGREPQGIVEQRDAARVLDEIAAGLLELRDPDGRAVFSAVHRRADIYRGEAIDLAPDLMLDSWSAGFRVAPSRGPSERFVTVPESLAGVDVAWSADHRPEGIFVAAGPQIAPGRTDSFDLYDVCPTALALLGDPVPEDLDGRAAGAALAAEVKTRPGLSSGPVRSGVAAGYSDEEAAAVAEHLKDLGYIE